MCIDDGPPSSRRIRSGARLAQDGGFNTSGRDDADIEARGAFDGSQSDLQVPRLTGSCLIQVIGRRHLHSTHAAGLHSPDGLVEGWVDRSSANGEEKGETLLVARGFDKSALIKAPLVERVIDDDLRALFNDFVRSHTRFKVLEDEAIGGESSHTESCDHAARDERRNHLLPRGRHRRWRQHILQDDAKHLTLPVPGLGLGRLYPRQAGESGSSSRSPRGLTRTPPASEKRRPRHCEALH
mmetsp:Transcript_5916/g.17278  ORF Transcript_5916/g.17278 Transcript_5916/m.17278 type:complete len:240 (-) Transcript_5916:115-834(-)